MSFYISCLDCLSRPLSYLFSRVVVFGRPWTSDAGVLGRFRRVCMRVCKRVCDVKMFCFSGANHQSTNLKKVLSWKTRQVYFIYPFPRLLKLEESLETCSVNFFFAWADILSKKKPHFGKQFFCKTKADYAYKFRVQDFATGRNFSFNPRSKQESFAFFLGKVIL